MYRSRNLKAITGVLVLCLGVAGNAQAGDIRTEQVRFPAGATGTRLEGRITGYEIVDYLLGAQAGQRMVVTMTTDSTANYFNLLAPGESEVAFFIGSTDGSSYGGRLPESGDYTIRVYQMRSAARRKEIANYRLDIEITNPTDPGVRSDEPVDETVPGTEFHATGKIPCAREAGQTMTQCEFGVIREGDGSGTVQDFWSDGGHRLIFFKNDTPVSFDSSEADGGEEMTVTKDVDLFKIGIGDQRFEIPDIVLIGDNPY